MKVEFLKSATEPSGYPYPYKPEIAMVGRSNAGKSSFINAFTGQKIAKVSQVPGKTRLLNFFAIDELFYLVDMPGYGFATGSRQEVESWKKMVETYLSTRKSLRGALLIMDLRRDWSEQERDLSEWFKHHQIPWSLILNKSDKVSRSQGLARAKKILSSLDSNEPQSHFLLSSAKKTGFEEIKKLVTKEWIK